MSETTAMEKIVTTTCTHEDGMIVSWETPPDFNGHFELPRVPGSLLYRFKALKQSGFRFSLEFKRVASNAEINLSVALHEALAELNWFDLSVEQQERQHKPLFDVLKGLDGK